MADLRAKGIVSTRKITEALNARNVPTPEGGR